MFKCLGVDVFELAQPLNVVEETHVLAVRCNTRTAYGGVTMPSSSLKKKVAPALRRDGARVESTDPEAVETTVVHRPAQEWLKEYYESIEDDDPEAQPDFLLHLIDGD